MEKFIKSSQLQINFGSALQGKRWSSSIPVEVRAASSHVIAAKGVPNEPFELSPGTYIVSAELPDGQFAQEIVKIGEGEQKSVDFPLSQFDVPETLNSDTSWRGAARDLRFFGLIHHSQRAIYGNWLGSKLGRVNKKTIKTAPFARSPFSVNFRSLPAVIEFDEKKTRSYFSVPADRDKDVIVAWESPAGGETTVRFDYKNEDLNTFLDYIRNEKISETKAMADGLMTRGGSSSPLMKILATFVLLGSNDVDTLDDVTASLYREYPDFPDAACARIEFLARAARHQEALDSILKLPERGAPWLRPGFSSLAARTKLYSNVTTANKESGLVISSEHKTMLDRMNKILDKLVPSLDLKEPTCVFRRHHERLI